MPHYWIASGFFETLFLNRILNYFQKLMNGTVMKKGNVTCQNENFLSYMKQ